MSVVVKIAGARNCCPELQSRQIISDSDMKISTLTPTLTPLRLWPSRMHSIKNRDIKPFIPSLSFRFYPNGGNTKAALVRGVPKTFPVDLVLPMASMDVAGVTDFEFHRQNDHDGHIIIVDNLSQLEFQRSNIPLLYIRIVTLLFSVASYIPMS